MTTMLDLEDMTLEDMRAALAPHIAANAVFDGWGNTARDDAARMLGMNPDHARLAFPDGKAQMIDAWIAHVDQMMLAACATDAFRALGTTARVREALLARFEAMKGRKDAVRRALAILALPRNAAKALQLGWRTADVIWRLVGDTATDLNHYTKRGTLLAVYAATQQAWLADETPDLADTRAFLDRRLGDVMKVEKAKANWKAGRDHHFSMARFLGRLRYPAR
jgi:ubiquinone biosynthesis protein COQ9